MTKTRLTALLLAVIMTMTLLGACAGTTPAETSGTTSLTTAGTTVPVQTDPPIDLGGYEFVLYGGAEDRYYPQAGTSQLQDEWADDLRALEEEINCTYKLVGGDTGYETYYTAVLAGTSLGDFCMATQTVYFPGGVTGIFEPLDSDKMKAAGFDTTDEDCWNQYYSKMTTFNGHTWGVFAASKYITMPIGFFLVFNKQMCQSEGYDMYDLVRNKQWTWDKYLEVAQACTADTDRDGVTDVWGVATTPSQGVEMFTNGSGMIGEVNGKWVFLGEENAAKESLEFISKEFSLGIRCTHEKTSDRHQAFADGKAAMSWVAWFHLQPHGGDPYWSSAYDYGVIPAPMGPSADNYITLCDGVDAWVMMTSNTNYEKSAIAMSAWGRAFNSDNWLERYNDDRIRDEESLEMFRDYIYPGLTINVNRINTEIRNAINNGIVVPVSNGSMTIMQAIESQSAIITGELDKFFRQN